MKVKKITSKQAEKIMDRLGLCYGDDGRTFYLTNEEETEVWEFDSLKERNEAYDIEMKKENKTFTDIKVDGKEFDNMYDALKELFK